MSVDPFLREEIHRIADTTIGQWQQALGNDSVRWAERARRRQLDSAIDAMNDPEQAIVYTPLGVVLRNGGRP